MTLKPQSKDQVSKNYMEEQKALHAGKVLPPQRAVCITGAAREGSIGQGIARKLHIQDGYNVWPNHDDVTSEKARAKQFSFGPYLFDTLVLCHGVTYLDWVEDLPFGMEGRIMEVNVTSHIRLVSQFVQETIDLPWRKQIVMIGSMAATHVLNGSAAYCASKAALNMFARCAAWELAPKGFDVFCINPSNTKDTPMTEDTIAGLERYRNLSRTDAEAYWGASLPRKEWLTTENIADLVSFLLSGKADYLSGCPLDLGGGQR